MMLDLPRGLVLAAVVAPWGAGCASAQAPTADPEAQRLDPPVAIIEAPAEAEAPAEVPAEAAAGPVSPTTLMASPETEVITFDGDDADPGMSDEVTAAPKRQPLPSMMSDVLHGPNK